MAVHEGKRKLESIPVGKLGVIPVEGCQELGSLVDRYLVDWRTERENEHKGSLAFQGYQRDSYVIKTTISRFGTGEAKGTGTLDDPFNVAAAIAKAQEVGETATTDSYYIKGKVKSISEQFAAQYGNASFTMVDEGYVEYSWKADENGESVTYRVSIPSLGYHYEYDDNGANVDEDEEDTADTVQKGIRGFIDRILAFFRKIIEFISKLFGRG